MRGRSHALIAVSHLRASVGSPGTRRKFVKRWLLLATVGHGRPYSRLRDGRSWRRARAHIRRRRLLPTRLPRRRQGSAARYDRVALRGGRHRPARRPGRPRPGRPRAFRRPDRLQRGRGLAGSPGRRGHGHRGRYPSAGLRDSRTGIVPGSSITSPSGSQTARPPSASTTPSSRCSGSR